MTSQTHIKLNRVPLFPSFIPAFQVHNISHYTSWRGTLEHGYREVPQLNLPIVSWLEGSTTGLRNLYRVSVRHCNLIHRPLLDLFPGYSWSRSQTIPGLVPRPFLVLFLNHFLIDCRIKNPRLFPRQLCEIKQSFCNH